MMSCGRSCLGDPRQRVHVDARVLVGDPVRGDLVELAGEVELHPVRQVAAVVQAHPEDLVAGADQRHHRRRVGARAGIRLDVDGLGAEQRLGAVDRQRLDDVDVLAAAVVALAGQALGVLVRQGRALAVHDRLRDEVLGRDHLERRLLPPRLRGEQVRDLGIDLRYGLGEVVGSEFDHGPDGISDFSWDRVARRRAARGRHSRRTRRRAARRRRAGAPTSRRRRRPSRARSAAAGSRAGWR